MSLISLTAAALEIDPYGALGRMTDGGTTEADRDLRASWRAAYIAATPDHRMRGGDSEAHPSAIEPLTFDSFDEFCQSVWTELERPEPLYVSAVPSLRPGAQAQFEDSDAAARWEYPPADRFGVPRVGSLAGTTGIVGYVDVQPPGQVRLVALHEIAHLQRDAHRSFHGHDVGWAEIYCELQALFIDQATAARWAFEWTHYLGRAVEHLDRDPDWLMKDHP